MCIKFVKKDAGMKMKQYFTDKIKGFLQNQSFFNIFGIFSPLLVLFKLLGIMPLSIENKKGKEIRVKASKLGLLLSSVLLILTIVHTVWAPETLIQLEKSAMIEFSQRHKVDKNITMENNRRILKNKQTMVVKILHPLLVCLTSLTARGLSVTVLLKRMPFLLMEINRIDQLLILPKGFFVKNLSMLLIMLLTMLIFNIPLMWFHVWQLSFFHTTWGSVWETFSMINIFTTASLEMQFVSFCYLITSRFNHVNKQLSSLVSEEFICEDKTDATWKPFSDFVKRVCRRKIRARKPKSNQTIIKTFSQMEGKHKYLERLSGDPLIDMIRFGKSNEINWKISLRSLKNGHILLLDVMEDINEIYQIHLLISIFAAVSKILFNMYFSIFGFITESNALPTRIQVRQLYIVCLWTIYYSLRFIVIVCAAHLASSESRKAKRTISKIDPRRFDLPSRQEIKMFSDHLSGRDFEFSACGFFRLNMSLITSSFSTGVTYLVVMAQFH